MGKKEGNGGGSVCRASAGRLQGTSTSAFTAFNCLFNKTKITFVIKWGISAWKACLRAGPPCILRMLHNAGRGLSLPLQSVLGASGIDLFPASFAEITSWWNLTVCVLSGPHISHRALHRIQNNCRNMVHFHHQCLPVCIFVHSIFLWHTSLCMVQLFMKISMPDSVKWR